MSVDFFSRSSSRDISTAASSLQKYADFRKKNLTDQLSTDRSRRHIQVLMEYAKGSSELRLSPSGELYLLHQSRGIFAIFQFIINQLKKLYDRLERLYYGNTVDEARFQAAVAAPLKLLFVEQILPHLERLMVFCSHACSNRLDATVQSTWFQGKPLIGKFLLITKLLHTRNVVPWTEPPASIPPHSSDSEQTAYLKLIAELAVGYIFNSDGSLNSYWEV